jgi:uncharacterized protein YdgA (DUF945 family)
VKKVIVGVVFTLLVLAYPAATWWFGKQTESVFSAQYKSLEQLPLLKVTKRDYRRGFANSTEVTTFEVAGDLIRELERTAHAEGGDKDQDANTKALKPLIFSVHSRISHGPFAAGQLAVAVTDSELVIDDEHVKEELAKILGDKKPLKAHTVFGFNGGGRSQIESPAFSHSRNDAQGDGTITWGGLKADLTFTRDMDSITMKGSMPKLEIKDPKGAQMLVSDIKMTGDQKRLFKDEPMLYSGTQRFDIAQIEIRPLARQASALAEGSVAKRPIGPVTMKNLSYVAEMPAGGGDFMDIATRTSIASLIVDQQDYGPVHYDVSMKRLHARTVANIYRAALRMYGDPAAMKRSPGAAIAPIIDQAKQLIAHNPELSIDRISFVSKHGEARVAARIKLPNATSEDLSRPLLLLGKVDATAELKLPAALLAELGGVKAQSAERIQTQQQMIAAQIDALAAQGYLTNTNGLLETTLAFKSGQLSANGKPFDPRALAGPKPAAEAVESDKQESPPRPRRRGALR